MQSHAESLLALKSFTAAAATKQYLDQKVPHLFPSLQENIAMLQQKIEKKKLLRQNVNLCI